MKKKAEPKKARKTVNLPAVAADPADLAGISERKPGAQINLHIPPEVSRVMSLQGNAPYLYEALKQIRELAGKDVNRPSDKQELLDGISVIADEAIGRISGG